LGLNEPFDIEGLRISLSCSIGVSHVPISELTEDSLLRFADIALFAAKDRGRNRVELLDGELANEAEARVRQRKLLRLALEENSLVMEFQPVVDSQTETIVGFESLARCRTRDGLLLNPNEFLDAASSSGIVWDLDRRAFELTCEAAVAIHGHAPGLIMASNFSALSIVQSDFVEFVDRTMGRYRVSPRTICIEMTESAAFEAGSTASLALGALRLLGVRIALDDFGTCYSSLSHLRNLPLDSVKIDKSFLTNIEHDESARSIAEAVVNLVRGLGLTTVAEGVENSRQLAAAQALGCTLIQGWHYSPARNLNAILRMLAANPSDSPQIPASWSKTWADAPQPTGLSRLANLGPMTFAWRESRPTPYRQSTWVSKND
jgi:EAL domain-containing protein (putative c-di-GMP-specific phosphodiesterase class I)